MKSQTLRPGGTIEYRSGSTPYLYGRSSSDIKLFFERSLTGEKQEIIIPAGTDFLLTGRGVQSIPPGYLEKNILGLEEVENYGIVSGKNPTA